MRILDLCGGAGGAARGYRDAGFDYVLGVDLNPQPRYPYDFLLMDAIAALDTEVWRPFDAIHASPPCQRSSVMSQCRPGLAESYECLIADLRERLIDTGLPYVIENVPGAPLKNPVTLCGQMFGLELYRHRLFETNWPLVVPDHPEHVIPASKAGHWKPGTIMSVAGHVAPIAHAREIMGIDWMTRDELTEAIPPAYTEYIGHQLIRHLQES